MGLFTLKPFMTTIGYSSIRLQYDSANSLGGSATNVALNGLFAYDSFSGSNFLSGATASASSSLSGFPASNAFDSNSSTWWQSNNNDVVNAYIQGNISSPKIPVCIELGLSGFNAAQIPKSFTILASNDNMNWISLGSKSWFPLDSYSSEARAWWPLVGEGWRLWISSVTYGAGHYCMLSEWDVQDENGTSLLTQGRIYASRFLSVMPAPNVLDGNPSTLWAGGLPDNGQETWLAYAYPPGISRGIARKVVLSIPSNGLYNSAAPSSFKLQYTIDGGNSWIDMHSWTQPVWSNPYTFTFNLP